jgi:hypothetical protein
MNENLVVTQKATEDTQRATEGLRLCSIINAEGHRGTCLLLKLIFLPGLNATTLLRHPLHQNIQ